LDKKVIEKDSNLFVQNIFPDYLEQISIIFLQPLSTNSENKDGKRRTKIFSPIILSNIFHNISTTPLPRKGNRIFYATPFGGGGRGRAAPRAALRAALYRNSVAILWTKRL
jgi:hypothetical protein